MDNDWLRKILDKADERGWFVIQTEMELPGRISLIDRNGVRITIEDRYGLGIEYYLDQLQARPRDEVLKGIVR